MQVNATPPLQLLTSSATSGDATSPSVVPSTAAEPVDTVSLSPQAQQAMAGTAPPTPPAWSNDEVAAALSTVNDTTGQVSVEDKLRAFALMGERVRSASSNLSGADRMRFSEEVMTFFESPFAQRVQGALDAVKSNFRSAGAMVTGDSTTAALAAFDALSTEDQQLFLGAASPQEAGLDLQTRVENYRQGQQAQAYINRAINGALGNAAYASRLVENMPPGLDVFRGSLMALAKLAREAGDTTTAELAEASMAKGPDRLQKAEAYVAAHGQPPPDAGKTDAQWDFRAHLRRNYAAPDLKVLTSALATLKNRDGTASAAAQREALVLVGEYSSLSTDYGPTRSAILLQLQDDPYAKHAHALFETVHGIGGMSRGEDYELLQVKRIHRLSAADRELHFELTNRPDESGRRPFASFESMIGNYETRSQVHTLAQGLLDRYGARHWSQINDKTLTDSPAFKALQKLIRNHNDRNDAWTGEAQKVLDAFAAMKLPAFSTDPELDPAAEAAATLRAGPSATIGESLALQTLQRISRAMRSDPLRNWVPPPPGDVPTRGSTVIAR